MEIWLNKYGVVMEKHEKEFYALARKLKKILKPLEKRMTYRELYEVADILGSEAVGQIVLENARKRDRELFARTLRLKRVRKWGPK